MHCCDEHHKQPTGPQTEEGGGSNRMHMGMGMMKKMMAEMGSGAVGPMAMMQKMMAQMEKKGVGEAANPMQGMMGMCMGMCAEMLGAVGRTASLAVFATPELHQLFEEWLTTLENRALELLQDKGEVDPAALAAALKISEQGATYLLAHLKNEGKIRLRAQTASTQ